MKEEDSTIAIGINGREKFKIMEMNSLSHITIYFNFMTLSQ